MSEATNKPRYRVALKSRTTDRRVNLAAFWVRDNGMISGSFEKEVDFIQLKDGTKITPSAVWVNLFDETPDAQPPAPVANNAGQPVTPLGVPIADDQTDIPF